MGTIIWKTFHRLWKPYHNTSPILEESIPDESRGSCPVLGEREGEIPSCHSTGPCVFQNLKSHGLNLILSDFSPEIG